MDGACLETTPSLRGAPAKRADLVFGRGIGELASMPGRPTSIFKTLSVEFRDSLLDSYH